MTFLAPQALWLLALLPVVVALHYLRARRRQRDVAALFLWRRAQANSARRKRISPSWLLALQLMFIAAASVGVAGPRLTAAADDGVIIVIDGSASMAAAAEVDAAAGTRLSIAVAAARQHLAGRSGIALVRAGVAPRLLVPLDAPQSELLAALDALRAGDSQADLLAAVDLGKGLLPDADVVVITDSPVELGQTEVVVVGESVENLGISAFDVGVGQAFIAVVASGRSPAQATVGLFSGGRELARSTVLVPAGGSGSVTFPLLEDDGPLGVLEARILAPLPDALGLDDVAFAGRRSLTVATDDLYQPLLRALQAAPGVTVFGAADARLAQADLKVVSRYIPDTVAAFNALAPGNYLLLPPPARAPEYHVVRTQDRVEPLMRFVDLNDALVGIDPEVPRWTDSETNGWQVLAKADDLTPLLRLRRTPTGSILQLAFHPSQSDVVLRPAFPALIANWVAAIDATPRLALGETAPGWAGPALEPGVFDLASGARAATAGVVPGQATGSTGAVALVSLLSAAESRLANQPLVSGSSEAANVDQTTQASGQGREASAAAKETAPSQLAVLLVIGGLLALVAEWWLYSGVRGRRLVG